MRLIVKVVLFIGIVCSSSVSATVKIVTTTQDLASIARSVGGEYVEVKSLTLGTRDPHFAEAKPSMIRKVYRADLLLLIGADMEIGWLPALLRSARNRDVQAGANGYLDLSTSVNLLGKSEQSVDRSMGDVHAKGNPHYWLDPNNGIKISRLIAERLITLDPEHQQEYQQQQKIFENKLALKILDWQKELLPLSDQPVVAYHKSLIYLANAFNFKIVAEVEPKPGIAPSAKHLNKLVSLIEKQKIKILMTEPYYERRSSKYLNEKTNIQIAVLPQSVGAMPEMLNYIDLFDGIVASLKQAGDF